MAGIAGDFTGFTLGEVHTSELGITRVSEGNRYTENLTPTFTDKTAQVAGVNGTYYWESFYTQQKFSINFAFDSITEKELHRLRQVFNQQELRRLIFDERPYKYYMVKVTGTPTFKTICFDENHNGQMIRIYKGEGTVEFTAFYPFAKSVHKYLNEFSCSNINEWKDSINMKISKDDFDGEDSDTIKIFNGGDLDTELKLYYNFNDDKLLEKVYLKYNGTAVLAGKLEFNNTFSKKGNDVGFIINCKAHTIEGYDSDGNLTGNLYNEYIVGGDFFKLPVCEENDYYIIESVGQLICHKAEYDYLYY